MAELEWLPRTEQTPSRAMDFSLDGRVRRVTGAVWLPDDFQATTPMVLLGHGASGDRYQAPIPHLCGRWVAECGYIGLAIDGPVHGLRRVGDGARGAFFTEMQRPGAVDDMVTDWQDAFAAVCGAKTIGQGPLGYFGLSMGSLFGIPLLASPLEFRAAVVGLCGTTGAASILADRLRTDAAGVTCPLLFLMQLEDELFPREGYLDLFDTFAAQDKRLHANPGLHPQVPAEEVAAAFDFLASRLTGEVPRRIINPLAE